MIGVKDEGAKTLPKRGCCSFGGGCSCEGIIPDLSECKLGRGFLRWPIMKAAAKMDQSIKQRHAASRHTTQCHVTPLQNLQRLNDSIE